MDNNHATYSDTVGGAMQPANKPKEEDDHAKLNKSNTPKLVRD